MPKYRVTTNAMRTIVVRMIYECEARDAEHARTSWSTCDPIDEYEEAWSDPSNEQVSEVVEIRESWIPS